MQGSGLSIEVRVGRPLRRWHVRLRAELEAAGHLVRFTEGASAPLPGRLLLLAESRVYAARSALFAPASGTRQAGEPEKAGADLVLCLDGSPPADRSALVPRFDGAAGDAALLRALLAGRAPVIRVGREGGGRPPREIVAGHPALGNPELLAQALDDVLGRLVTLLCQAVARVGSGGDAAGGPPTEDPRLPAGSTLSHLARVLARKVRRRLGQDGGEHWRAGWRFLDEPAALSTFAWPPEGYATLPDDGSAYYADPFPFAHEGRRVIFCEKFPYATGKGVIVAFEVDAAGGASAPRLVLEHAVHLSYPQVFARGGAIFMLPEMGAANRVELFRAERFPDRWVPHAVLVDGMTAYDATFIDFENRCWLFASSAGPGESSWDQLALFHAPTLEGPWRAHRGNPVLIDAGAARPAGAMWVEDGVLWRVAQDCRTGYGTGLALCRVDRLDEDGYSQTVVRRLGPPPGLRAEGAHTLNRSAGLEVTDWRGRPTR